MLLINPSPRGTKRSGERDFNSYTSLISPRMFSTHAGFGSADKINDWLDKNLIQIYRTNQRVFPVLSYSFVKDIKVVKIVAYKVNLPRLWRICRKFIRDKFSNVEFL